MDTFLIFHRMDKHILQADFLADFPHYCVLVVLLSLLISYFLYCKVLWRFLEKSKSPKLYKITTLHSLWMGSIHLMTSTLCFSQLNILHNPSAAASQPYFMSESFNAATANFCQQNKVQNNSVAKSEGPGRDLYDWSSFNSISVILICAILIQEILLATRNKMDNIFYSRLLALMFVVSAVKSRCPILSIQGTYLMSINSSSTEIARALVAWKSYSQEDSDHRPSPAMKAVTFIVFLYHMVIWCSLMLYFMPFFIHKLPSISENDPNRLFLAYAYLSFLAYIVLEAGTSSLWTTLRCMGSCRRSSGLTWRIFALSDCHLLGHYSPLVLELYNIQLVLDTRKSIFRNKMVQKHLASLEGKKRKTPSDSQARRPASLLAAVKTMVALKKKMQRRYGTMPARSMTVEDLPQVLVTTEDPEVDIDILPKEVEAPLTDNPKSVETSGDVEEKPTTEKDEETSMENVMDATFTEHRRKRKHTETLIS